MRTIADMKTAGMTLLEMLDSARDEQHMPHTLESLCAEASSEIRRLESKLDALADELGRLMDVVCEYDQEIIAAVMDADYRPTV